MWHQIMFVSNQINVREFWRRLEDHENLYPRWQHPQTDKFKDQGVRIRSVLAGFRHCVDLSGRTFRERISKVDVRLSQNFRSRFHTR
ncbi:hypothetical protein B566_EDAN011973 [Ephemera danica]|nr:hypothetical protein B566_EDAN011973 [Ephemera danica]